MKIACIYHPKPYLQDPTAQYGLGLLALATLARSCGGDVSVIDGQDREPDWVPDEKADVWLLGGCLVDRPVIKHLVDQLEGRIVIGGPISHSPEIVPSKATVVAGPGEPFVEELVTGRILPLDFDRYPIPDRSLLSRYGGNIYHPKSGAEAGVSTTLLTSRGCRYLCAFCTSGCKNTTVHDYPLGRIEQELYQILGLGIADVRISDDNIMSSPKRLLDVCRLFRTVGIRWRASLRVSNASEDIYEEMAASGCVEISFGVESADPHVLRVIRKGSSVEQAELSISGASSAGMHVRMLIMMGTPGERPETLSLNKQFIEKFPKAVASLAMFYPFPGTQIHQDPSAYGCVLRQSDDANICAFRPRGSTPEANIEIIGGLSKDELTKRFLEMRQFLVDRGQENRGVSDRCARYVA